MAMTDQQVQDIARMRLTEFNRSIEVRLATELRKKKLVASGDLLNSIKTELIRDSEGIYKSRISYLQSGKFVELKRIQFGSPVPGVALENWVEKNLSKFKRVPGYPKRKLSDISKEIAVKRISNAIGYHRATKFKHKGRIWSSKAIYDEFNKVLTDILDKYAEIAPDFIITEK